MGQSQLLIVVIGVFIIAIAILAGTDFFESDNIDANKRAIVTDINQIAHLAVRYYSRPPALGGGRTQLCWFCNTEQVSKKPQRCV